MERTVERLLIDIWVAENGPNGVAALGKKSGVSPSMISKIRTGRVPTKPITRKAVAKAIGTTEDKLFPRTSEGKQAS